jgi:Tol biopolymer transport system component
MNRLATRFVAALAICCSFALTPAAARASFPGKNGKIVFSGDTGSLPGNHYAGVQSINLDGTGLEVVHPPTCAGSWCVGDNAAVSANGRQIAFIGADANYQNQIYAVDVDGSGLRQVTLAGTAPLDTCGSCDGALSWSPDGTKIAFVASGSVIATVRTDGSGVVERLTSGHQDASPAWSPGGTKIAFSRTDPSHNVDVWLMSPDGTGQTQLTHNVGFAPGSPYSEGHAPNWSPNGTKIVFLGVGPGTGSDQLWTISADGTEQKQITNVQSLDHYRPVFSPDGTKIAWHSSNVRSSSSIRVVNADGTSPDPSAPYGMLVAREWVLSGLDWQPTPASMPDPLPGSGTGQTSGPGTRQTPKTKPHYRPKRSHYKSARWFCRAKRAFLGHDAFHRRYGLAAMKKCVAVNRRSGHRPSGAGADRD